MIPKLNIKLPFMKKKKEKKKLYEQYKDSLLVYLTSPSTIDRHSDYIKIDKFHRIVASINYPRVVDPGWLTRLIEMNLDFDLSMHIKPYPIESSISMLESEIKKQKTDLYALESEGKIIPQSLIQKHQDTMALLNQIQQGREKMFDMSLYIDTKSHNKKELDKVTSRIKASMASIMISPKVPSYQMYTALRSTLPIGDDELHLTRNITSSAAASCFPFAITSLEHHATGILIGFNQVNNIPIIIDPFELSNPNMLVLGTSGGGKSIAKDEPVLIRENGIQRLVKIGEFIDDLISTKGCSKIDDLEGVINPEVEVYTFNGELKGEWSRVTIAARKKAPDTLYKFKTSSGRRIKTTGDHNIVVIRDGKLVNIKAPDVRPEDFVPIPRAVKTNISCTELNLLEFMRDRGLYVNAEELIDKNYEQIKKNLPIDKDLEPYLYKYRKGRAVPIDYFLKLVEKAKIILTKDDLQGMRIRAGSGKQSLPAVLPLSNEVMRLLGYITAEGCITDNAVMISNLDRTVIHDVIKCADFLGINSFEANRGINIACKAFVEFIKALSMDKKSAGKNIPDVLFSVDNEKLGEYLKAYFEGDGCIEGHKITATTKSGELASQLSYLLLKFGIIARIHEKEKTATNTGYTGIYHEISISGRENFKRFLGGIGFISEEKNKKVRDVLASTSHENTNVDLIPNIEGHISKINDVLHFGNQKRNYAIVRREFTPSKKLLKKVVNEIESRLYEIENLSIIMAELESLPNLSNIVKVGSSDKGLNSLLYGKMDETWRLMKNSSVESMAGSVFRATEIITGDAHHTNRTHELLGQAFDTLGLGVQSFDPSVYAFVNGYTCDIGYKRIENSIKYLSGGYKRLKRDIEMIEPDIDFLRLLTNSDLFWDRITKVDSEKCGDSYVYDLTVDNEVFLAGFGGMFVHNSYCIKLMLMREFMEGVDINVIDPQAEYTDLAKRFEGKVIRIAPDSDTVINPLDLMGQSYDEKKLSLLSFFRVLMGELTETQRAILDDCIDSTYEDAGIARDPRTWAKKPPVLEDLYDHVLPLTRSDKDIIYKPAMSIITRLKPFVTGGLRFLNQHTQIDLDNRFISFDIRDIPDVGKGTIMFLLLEYIYNRMKKSRKRRICVVDEAWTVLSAGTEGEYIFRLIKTCRKFNLSLVLLTQDVEDVITSRAGRAVMANTATKLLLKQDTTVIDNIIDKFHLNEAEAEFVRRSGVGSALLMAENSRIPIYIQASPEEHRIITTKPEELSDLIREPTAPEIEREVKLKFDISKPFHREAQLTYEEMQTLTKVGFHEFKVETLEGVHEMFMIKNETSETDDHFILQQLIRDEIKKYTDRVLIHYTTLPDITFETPNGEIVAVEIIVDPDIGTCLDKMEKKMNILKRYNSYFFIIDNKELKKHEEFGEVVMRTNAPTKIRNFFG